MVLDGESCLLESNGKCRGKVVWSIQEKSPTKMPCGENEGIPTRPWGRFPVGWGWPPLMDFRLKVRSKSLPRGGSSSLCVLRSMNTSVRKSKNTDPLLEKFKDEAKSRVTFATGRLGSPDPNDERPRPSLPFVPSTILLLQQQENQRFKKLTRDGAGAIAP